MIQYVQYVFIFIKEIHMSKRRHLFHDTYCCHSHYQIKKYLSSICVRCEADTQNNACLVAYFNRLKVWICLNCSSVYKKEVETVFLWWMTGPQIVEEVHEWSKLFIQLLFAANKVSCLKRETLSCSRYRQVVSKGHMRKPTRMKTRRKTDTPTSFPVSLLSFLHNFGLESNQAQFPVQAKWFLHLPQVTVHMHFGHLFAFLPSAITTFSCFNNCKHWLKGLKLNEIK